MLVKPTSGSNTRPPIMAIPKLLCLRLEPFGCLTAQEPVPSYRLSMTLSLAAVGPVVVGWWLVLRVAVASCSAWGAPVFPVLLLSSRSRSKLLRS